MIPIDFRTAGNIRQRWTHRGLVNRTEQRRHYPGLPLDAIVVPASRAAGELETAVTLARAAGSQLVILCSHEAVPEAVHEYLVKRSFGDAIVVGIPDDYRHDLLDFQALSAIEDKIPAASCYSTNLSTKRNLGLIMARMLGWERIFFLDDDIRDIALPDLQSTVAMLASYRAAGMRVTEFPDNSAACHAHRMTRGTQDVFLTGAALAVDVRPKAGFFPRLYNEDWLYFYDDALNGQLASSGRSLTQLVYDPFADPQRAAWQEFGDTLVEGLYALLGDGRGLLDADGDYWFDFLYARQLFLKGIVSRVELAPAERREALLRSVEASLECSMMIEPGLLEHYVRLWRQDVAAWGRRMSKLGREMSVEKALEKLDLSRADYRPVSMTACDGPSTTPYELRDLLDLLEADQGGRRLGPAEQGKPQGGSRRPVVPLTHGLTGKREAGLVPAGRGFWPGRRSYAAAEQRGEG